MESFLHFYSTTRLGTVPLNVFVYKVLLVACWAYALRRGGPPEKIGTTILAIGSFLTAVAVSGPTVSYRSVETGILIVDLLCLLGFLTLALRADRFWPLWVAALQVIGTAGHAVKYVDPGIIRQAYAFMLVIWAYPMILLLVIGTRRHQQRLSHFGADKSWSGSRW